MHIIVPLEHTFLGDMVELVEKKQKRVLLLLLLLLFWHRCIKEGLTASIMRNECALADVLPLGLGQK